MGPSTTGLRWMWVWITVAALVVVVVIGFLFSIAGALESIDESLDRARAQVTSASGDVKPLPEHIEDINVTLKKVENNLEPLPEQATRVAGELESIKGTLVLVDGTLEETESLLNDTANVLTTTERSLDDTAGELTSIDKTLVDVEGTLNDTTGLLVDVDDTLENAETDLVDTRRLAGRINRRLTLAQEFRSFGTNMIFKQVRFLNGSRGAGPDDGCVGNCTVNENGLRFVETDADGIELGLFETDKHLASACRQIPLPPFEC